MEKFTVNSPNWNDMTQLSVIGEATITENNTVILPTTEGKLYISINDLGVRLQSGSRISYDYGMLKDIPKNHVIKLQKEPDKTIISSQQFTLSIEHNPFSFNLMQQHNTLLESATDGHFVRRFRLPPLTKINNHWFMAFNLKSSEPVYGLGEKWSQLNKRGQLIRSFNHDALGVNAEISYKNTPFAWSPNGWGVFVHTPAPVTHGVGFAPWSQRAYCVLIEDTALDVFILTAASGAEMLERYTQLTGKAPVPPDWSLGVILSKAYYRDVPELLSTARKVREKNMPCDVITLDGRAWQDTETRFAFEWDSKRYPDPKSVIDELKSMDFKVCVWEYPLISVKNPLFHTLAEKGWLIKDKRTDKAFEYEWDMSAFGEVLTPLPKSGILDFTHPDAYQFWRDSHKPLFDMGVDMIKADFGEQIEDDNMVAYNGEQGQALHNIYSLLYNRCVYEAAEKYCKTGPFLFSRSAWTGSQCYPSQWGGDPQSDWGGLAASIRGALSWGLSGAPYYATDVGGFYKDTRDSELYSRWIQAAVFSAHMRLHGIGNREPWSYSEAAESAANKALSLRYQLLPYIHKTIQQSSETGLPVMRAMVLAFPEQPQTWAFEDQFMFGDDILVAPCLQPGGKVSVWLPEGEWLWFENKACFNGNQLIHLTLSLDQMAVFVKKGRRIPLAKAVTNTTQLPDINAVENYWPA